MKNKKLIKKKKTKLQHSVFVLGHPSKYLNRRTGLNFAERTKHVPLLVVAWLDAERIFLKIYKMGKGIEKNISDTAEQNIWGIWKWELLFALVIGQAALSL